MFRPAMLVAAALLGTGCDHFCTNVGYESGAALAIDTATADSVYAVAVEVESESVQLAFVLDAERNVMCDAQPCEARGNRVRLTESWGDGTLTAGRIHVLVTGLRDDLRDERYPDDVIVRVSRDGLPVYAENHDVAYETSEPNGEGCGERVYGKIALAVP